MSTFGVIPAERTMTFLGSRSSLMSGDNRAKPPDAVTPDHALVAL